MASVDLNSQPRQQPIFWNHLVSWIRTVPRVAILSMVGPSLLCVLGYFGWLYYGARNLDMAYYGLKKENVHITDQPDWIRKTNVLDEVFEGASLSRQSLLDARTPGNLASVFDAHPWVRKTHRVQPLAGGVKIDLEYRIPVAMVHLGDKKFFPIDVDAVLLDTVDFNDEDTKQYIRIYAKDADTNGKKGKPFGDPRIDDAAKLCWLLLPHREACRISRVIVCPPSQSLTGKPRSVLEIYTIESGPSFRWGSTPGNEMPGEPTADNKLKQLISIVSDNKQWKPGMVDLSGSQK